MKLKVKLLDKKLVKNYREVLSFISLISSFLFIVITIPDCLKIYFGFGLLILFLIVYAIMWIIANNNDEVSLIINNSNLIIKTGDIFEQEGLKVIAFNEYFDTLVDNKIISETSLNGIYIKTKVNDINELDNLITSDNFLNKKILDTNKTRTIGKKKKYSLGTIFQNNEYLLTAFTKFDDDNRAYLTMQDFINFLLNFWNEIDILYAGKSVSIPLLGTGITRFKENNNVSDQELLELLIWSFKISRIKFTYPSQVTIIVHESKKDKINFYSLKA
jgi:hypothetical protein